MIMCTPFPILQVEAQHMATFKIDVMLVYVVDED